jgi:hypothetical protein
LGKNRSTGPGSMGARGPLRGSDQWKRMKGTGLRESGFGTKEQTAYS